MIPRSRKTIYTGSERVPPPTEKIIQLVRHGRGKSITSKRTPMFM
jgi:hypothetical protein